MATLKELANRTGYSTATISRILSGDPSLSVTPEARRKVLEEAGRLNYTATRSRRGRAPKVRLRLGLAEMLTPEQQLDDPYYLYLSDYVRQNCQDQKYACVPLGSGFTLPPDETPLDGIAAVGIFTAEEIDALAAQSPNLVFLDSSPFESRFDSVVLGFELGISLALEHLANLGHRHIGFVGPERKLDDRRRPAPEIRRQYFRRLTEALGLRAAFIDCPMEASAAAQAVRARLSGANVPPTALLCANEETAVGALLALREAGWRVPEEMSVVSFNDTPRSALLDPPLTSISAQEEEMARAALRLLSERAVLPGKTPLRTLPLKVVVPPTLTVRRSTGPVSGQNC